MRPHDRTLAVALSAAATLLPLGRVAHAQDTSPGCPAVREMAQAAVPAAVGNREVMSRLLGARVGAQLSQTFDPIASARSVGDVFQPEPRCARDRDRACSYRNRDEGSLLHFNLRAGRAVYLSPARRFHAARGVDNTVAESDARRIALAAVDAFGVPRGELGTIDVSVLKAAVQDTARRTPTQVLRAELHVGATRQVDGTPVLASRTLAAVGQDGRIARLYVRWPDFRLLPGLSVESTLPRPAVVDRVVERIEQENSCGSVGRVRARIAYVPSTLLESADEDNASLDGEDVAGFVPALEVFVVPPDDPVGDRPPRNLLAEQEFIIPLLAVPAR